MKLVLNASPVIVLAKSGLLDSLIQLTEQAWIPEPVASEVCETSDPSDPARAWIDRHSGLVQSANSIPAFITAWDLGAGESAVLALAAENPGFTAVLDDLAARRCAQAMGLEIVGTIGLILLGKRAGVIPTASAAFDAVVAAGLYISPAHLARARHLADE